MPHSRQRDGKERSAQSKEHRRHPGHRHTRPSSLHAARQLHSLAGRQRSSANVAHSRLA